MHIDKRYTADSLLADSAFAPRVAGDGHTYIVPRHWGQAAVEALVSHVFYPAPLPDMPEGERDIRQVLHRVAGSLAEAGRASGLFDAAVAENFYDELRALVVAQAAMPEVALLARQGLGWAYGIAADPYRPAETTMPLPDTLDAAAGTVAVADGDDAPQLQKRLSLLAGAAALGGARLSAQVPAEHPEAFDIATAARRADIAQAAAGIGRRMLRSAAAVLMDACDRDNVFGFDTAMNPRLARAAEDARRAGLDDAMIETILGYARMGAEDVDFGGTDDAPDFPAVILSAGDNLVETALTGHGLRVVRAGAVDRHLEAPKLWDVIAESVWAAGAPRLLLRDNAGLKNAVLGPLGGLVFTAGAAAPSGTVNLAFFDDGRAMDTGGLLHAVTVLATALDLAYGDTGGDRQLSGCGHRQLSVCGHRPLSIGVANLSALVMARGFAYDSDAGRALAGAAVAYVSGAAHLASARMAAAAGAHDRYADSARETQRRMQERITALSGGGSGGLLRRPVQLSFALAGEDALHQSARAVWEAALEKARDTGLRHAHLTGFSATLAEQTLLGAQTRGIAPENALARFEGYYNGDDTLYGKKFNPAAARALAALGYDARQIDDIHAYAVGHGTLTGAPFINHETLAARGVTARQLALAERALPQARDLRHVFSPYVLGPDVAEDALAALGFTEDEIDAATLYVCGAMTLEGAPHLSPDHLPVFDTASHTGVRFVTPAAQLRMQGAVEPFLNGAAGGAVMLDPYATIDDVAQLMRQAWEWGLKSLSLWRAGASLNHGVVPQTRQIAPASAPKEQKRKAKSKT